MTKICSICKDAKDEKLFHKNLGKVRNDCKECRKKYRKKPEIVERRKKNWKEKYRANQQIWYDDNKEVILNKIKKYNKRDDVVLKRKEKYRTDINLKIKDRMRKMVKRCRNGNITQKRTAVTLGYTSTDFLNKFKTDIEEYIVLNIPFHVDHKIPINWFIEEAPINIINALDNLQILSAKENRSKWCNYAAPVNIDYYKFCINYIKTEFKNQIIII